MNKTRPYLNKYVKRKQQQILDNYHCFNLKDMKPITSKLMEYSETIINKGKTEMIKEVRETEIQRENKLLLEKIASVMTKKGKYSVSKTKNIRTKASMSLNQIFRKKQFQDIQLENKRFLERLQHKKPTLNNTKLDKDWADNKSVIKRMANYQFNLTNIKSTNFRTKRVVQQRSSRFNYSRLKVSKYKTLDGHRLLIKIQFVDDMLKIIANSQDQKDLKVIEIPKEEGLDLIQKECQGKIQLLLNKLRYDHDNGTLYLINEDISEGEIDFSEFNPESERVFNKNKSNEIKNKRERQCQSSLQQNQQITQKSIKQEKQQTIPQIVQVQKHVSDQPHIIIESTKEKEQILIKMIDKEVVQQNSRQIPNKKDQDISNKNREQKKESSLVQVTVPLQQQMEKVQQGIKEGDLNHKQQVSKESVKEIVQPEVQQNYNEQFEQSGEVQKVQQKFNNSTPIS